MDWTPLWLSAKLALLTTLLIPLAAAPLACLLAFRRFWGKSVLDALITMPMVLPPTVLGFGLLMVMSPSSPFGKAWEALFGAPLPFSFSGLVLGSLVYSLPFGVLPMRAAFEKVDPGIVEAARCSGMTHGQAFRHVILPNAMGGVTASAALIFAHTVGEFGVALMLGGSIPGKTRVASIAIFEHTESLEYGQAGLLSLALMIVSYAALLHIGRQSMPCSPSPRKAPAASCRDFQDTKRGFHADHIHAVR